MVAPCLLFEGPSFPSLIHQTHQSREAGDVWWIPSFNDSIGIVSRGLATEHYLVAAMSVSDFSITSYVLLEAMLSKPAEALRWILKKMIQHLLFFSEAHRNVQLELIFANDKNLLMEINGPSSEQKSNFLWTSYSEKENPTQLIKIIMEKLIREYWIFLSHFANVEIYASSANLNGRTSKVICPSSSWNNTWPSRRHDDG